MHVRRVILAGCGVRERGGGWLNPLMARKAAPESHHLRPLRADDAAAVLRVFETSPGMDRQGEVRDLEAASAYVNLLSSGPEHRGWVIAGDDDALIGLVAIDVNESNRSGAVTYWMGEPDRGRGLTRRAVATIADWALSEDGLDLDRLDLEHVAGDRHAGNVARAAGFLQEGTLRDRLLAPDGGREDVLVYGRLADDPLPIVARLVMRPA